MGKNSNFFGQPIYGQLIKSLDREKIVGISRKHGGEKYVKSFDGYTHLLTMLYAVIQRFDSLREIETSMTAEVRKLRHVGIETVPRRSTLSDANARRSEKFFEEVYRDLYAANKDILSSDSRRNGTEEWIKQLRIIDSTTITLFSNAIFKGVGRHLKTGKKKGGINHIARIITYVDIKKGKKPKLISLLTNDFDMPLETIVAIYRRRWQIESLFKQIKQNFPLRYFYGESANAIKIQIWVTLIANLLLSVLQSSLQRSWSFSGLATIVRIVLMYYLNLEKFLNQPDADLKIMLAEESESPPDDTENC